MSKKTQKVSKVEQYEVLASIGGQDEDPVKIAQRLARIQATAIGGGGSSRDRQNIAYQGLISGKYASLYTGFSGDGSMASMSFSEMVRLCQLAYFNNGTVGNVIDIMQEFSSAGLDFISTKKASKEAIFTWSDAVGLRGFIDQIFLEYYRSGNVIIYRFEGALPALIQGGGMSIAPNTKIPVRYTLLNPANIKVSFGLFGNVSYQIVIPAVEVQKLLEALKKDPEAVSSYPAEFKEILSQNVGRRGTQDAMVTLNPDNLITLFRKKQPYECYAVPFLARVLDDIDFKRELRNMDRAISRVVARMLIHVKIGKDDKFPSKASIDNISNMLANPSTSTYLVTDHMVDIAQHFPDVASMLDPRKYEAVNRDILQALGISAAATGDGAGSFSNNFLGIKVLVERIQDGRSQVMDSFLIPEVNRVAKALRLKVDIIPNILGVDLNDEKEWAKIYSRLGELGVFSPQSVIESIRDRRLPTYTEEVERQGEAKELRDKGLFQPVLNKGGTSDKSGKPTGTVTPPQTSPKTKRPTGASAEKIIAGRVYVEGLAKKKLGLEELTVEQKTAIENMCVEYLSAHDYAERGLTICFNKLFKQVE